MSRFFGSVVVVCLAVSAGWSKVFVSAPPSPTMREDAKIAELIIYGYVARSSPGEKDGDGLAEFHVLEVLKPHPAVKAKVVFFPRHIPIEDPANPARYVVYCDVRNGKI